MEKNIQHKKCSIIVITRETPLMILKRCINCIRSQTYKNIEIILLNANEPESSYKQAILDNNPFFSGVIRIDQPETHEFAKGKVRAIERSTGEYIAILNAQDTMPETRIAAIIHTFKENKDACLIYTDMAVQQENILEQTPCSTASHQFRYLSQAVFHRDSIHLAGSFDKDLTAHCDEEFLLRIQSLHLEFPLSSPETIISVCPDAYENYSSLESAIGYRQIGIKHAAYFKKNKRMKKELYHKIADSYQKSHVFLRYLQFRFKAYLTGGLHRRKGNA